MLLVLVSFLDFNELSAVNSKQNLHGLTKLRKPGIPSELGEFWPIKILKRFNYGIICLKNPNKTRWDKNETKILTVYVLCRGIYLNQFISFLRY